MTRSKRPPMKQATKVGALLKQVLGDRGMDDRLNRYQAWLIWDKIVGETIANRARPLRFRQGTLEVQVDHPVWMQQLQMLKPKILEKLNQQLPDAGITDIYLRKAPTPIARPPKQKASEELVWQSVELDDEEIQQVEKLLRELPESELKEEMRRVLMSQKRLDKVRHQADD